MHRCEPLEPRRLFVTVGSPPVDVYEGYPGFYEVHDHQFQGNTVTIDVGWNPGGGSYMDVNGAVFYGAEYVSVFMYDGQDAVTINSAAGVPFGASVILGPGNDSATTEVDCSVWGGDGDDDIEMADAFRGEVYGGSGDDGIVLTGDCFDMRIKGDAGNDVIDASANGYPVFAEGGDGNDVLWGSGYDDELHGEGGVDRLYGLAGDDHLYAGDGETDGTIVGGSGIDHAFADPLDSGVIWGCEYVSYA